MFNVTKPTAEINPLLTALTEKARPFAFGKLTAEIDPLLTALTEEARPSAFVWESAPASAKKAKKGKSSVSAKGKEKKKKVYDPEKDAKLVPDPILDLCLGYLKATPYFAQRKKKTSKMHIWSGSRRGNSVYAYRQRRIIEHVIKQFDTSGNKCLFITCTTKIDYTNYETVAKSYAAIKEEIPKFVRKLKKFCCVKHVYAVESYKQGGAHVHFLVEGAEELKVVKHKGKSRLVDEELLNRIKSAWGIGHVDVLVASDNSATGYLAKELTKGANVEAAVYRLKAGKPQKNDVNRVWCFFYMAVCKKGSRMWGTSRNIDRKIPARLDNIMSNSTDDEIVKSIEEVEEDEEFPVLWLSKDIVNQDWFIAIQGEVTDPIMEQKLNEIYDAYLLRLAQEREFREKLRKAEIERIKAIDRQIRSRGPPYFSSPDQPELDFKES